MAIRRVTRAGVGLVLGIIILAVLVYAGLLIVRERGEQARREDAIAIADQQLQDESANDGAIKPEGTEQTQPSSSEPEQSTPTPQAGTPSTQPAATAELPQTGPAEQFGTLVVLALVSFTAAAYVRSRKLVRNS